MTNNWTQTGVGLLQAGQSLKALECFEQAILQNPDDADAWCYKATALIQLQRYAQSRLSYQRALALNPLLWTVDGNRLLQAGQYDQAINCFNEALAKCPNDATTWAKKGAALLLLGKSDEALGCLQRSQALGDAGAATLITELTRTGR